MNAPGYEALHLRVRKLRGRPSQCEICDTTDLAKRYEWASLTGCYADPADYARLCKLCHCQFDHARREAAQGRSLYRGLSGRQLLDHLAERRRAARGLSGRRLARMVREMSCP